jgi:hypothetical protein
MIIGICIWMNTWVSENVGRGGMRCSQETSGDRAGADEDGQGRVA